MKKTKQTEFVFTGKDYNSIQRAEEKIKKLKANNYKQVSKNSKKLTFQK